MNFKGFGKAIIEKRNIIFSFILIITFIVWIGSIFIEGVYCNRYTAFFNRTIDFFADFTNMIGLTSGRNPYFDESHGSYPPFAYLLIYLFTNIVEFPVEKFLFIYQQPQFLIIAIIFIILIILVCAFFLAEIIKKHCNENFGTEYIFIIFCLTLSYPVLYIIERGNILLLSFALVLGYFAFKDSESKILRELALIFLAMAFAIKITPAIFGLLLLSEKRYKDAIRCAIYGLLLLFLPFLFFEGGIIENFRQMIINMTQYPMIYEDIPGLSLRDSIKIFVSEYFVFTPLLNNILRIFTLICCGIIFVDFFIEKQEWKKIMILTLLLILIPSHTNSYYTIFLIPATLIFLTTADKNFLNFFIMLVQVLFYSIYFNSFSIDFNNIALPILMLYLMIDSFINFYKKLSRNYSEEGK